MNICKYLGRIENFRYFHRFVEGNERAHIRDRSISLRAVGEKEGRKEI